MKEMLESSAGRRIVSMQRDELLRLLINDAYKAKMHKVYARYFTGVTGDFALNVRRTTLSLLELREEHAGLFEELTASVERLCSLSPYTERTREALDRYFLFHTDEAMQQRAKANGVTRKLDWVTTREEGQEQLIAVASGPIESASHVETSLMQLVQEFMIRAQAHKLARQTGVRLDRTERLANSLGKLAGSVSRINAKAESCVGPSVRIALFAGRRSSDRVYLLLQNLFCMLHLKQWIGTSSIAAAECLHSVLMEHSCPGVEVRDGQVDRLTLIGTHAHEMQSVTQQLLCKYDYEGGDGGAPVCVSALLAHLLFMVINGRMEHATALCDTFGTRAFVAAALAADVPQEFIDDMAAKMPAEPPIPKGAKVFDLMKVWRLDSGDYREIAKDVLFAWEKRCMQAREQGLPQLPRPRIMNSNLESVDEVLEMMSLEEELRPIALGFGTLMDGFVPFHVGSGSGAANGALENPSLNMASVVMKAVQAYGPPHMPRGFKSMSSASKLGDEDGKLQVDPRLGEADREDLLHELQRMKQQVQVDPVKVSKALADGYHAVTRLNILGESPASSQGK